ncbi:MAG: rhomboid family intramembrane serine protease [Telmatospirillum sp.]|nr:rhomboid family intramembrane serine protease [Telmatospirillum sp.]
MPSNAREPAINLPPLTLALIVVNVGIFGALRLFESRIVWLANDAFGFTPVRFSGDAALGLSGIVSPLSYMFLHGDWVHLAMNMVMLAAFGSGVERRFGAASMLSLYLLSGAIAAGAHYVVYAGSIEPMIGASGGISGLVGCVLVAMRQGGAGNGPGWLLGAAAMWAIPTVLFGILGVPGTDGSSIAWVAHLGGFFGGIVLAAILLAGSQRQS